MTILELIEGIASESSLPRIPKPANIPTETGDKQRSHPVGKNIQIKRPTQCETPTHSKPSTTSS
jgi:hypothetical protein